MKADKGPDKRLAAVCGLFCAGCSLYIATREDPQRLSFIAARLGVSEEEARCHGCHSDQRGPYCITCKMLACSREKGIDFCVECAQHPCADYQAFQSAAPHRAELLASQQRIREIGWEAWYAEQQADYACPACGATNSAYDLACRKCGQTPGCPFAGRHAETVKRHLEGMRRG